MNPSRRAFLSGFAGLFPTLWVIRGDNAGAGEKRTRQSRSATQPDPLVPNPRVDNPVITGNATQPDEAPGCDDDPWLAAWLRQPRLPLLRHHLPLLGDHRHHERTLATHIMTRIRNGEAMSFLYHGGSDPGSTRRIYPTLLFTTPIDTANPDHPRNPIYLLAYCLTRHATRVFRLDRMTAEHSAIL